MPQYPKKVTLDHIPRAVKELDFKAKYNPGAYYARLVRNRLEFQLTTGQVLTWPPEPAPEAKPAAKTTHSDARRPRKKEG